MKVKMLIPIGGKTASGEGASYVDLKRGDVVEFSERLAWQYIENGYCSADYKAEPGLVMDISRAREAFKRKYPDRTQISTTT
jgi:hypothetical protein